MTTSTAIGRAEVFDVKALSPDSGVASQSPIVSERARQTEAGECDACGEADAQPALRVDDRLLMRCCACGLVRLTPRPTADELNEVYDGSYYTTRPPEEPRGLGEVVRRAVLARFWGYPFALSPLLQGFLGYILLRPLKHRVMPVPFPKGNQVLDVGCGNGQRLAELERCGLADLFGVEPTVGAADVARRSTQAQIFKGVLEEARYPDRAFGLVILNQVLEHVPSPTATLREIHRILKPGGRLYLTVPNFGSIEARLCGRQWAGLRLPEHLHHFTPEPLLQMIEQAGFRIEIWRTDTVIPIMRESLESLLAANRSSLTGRVMYRVCVMLAPLLATFADVLERGQMLRAVAIRV